MRSAIALAVLLSATSAEARTGAQMVQDGIDLISRGLMKERYKDPRRAAREAQEAADEINGINLTYQLFKDEPR